MNSNHIAGDFGRRECCGNSKFHKGVDVTAAGGNGDLGYGIITPVPGTITKIKKDDDYKYIVIDGPDNQDFAYGHIFQNSTVFPFVMNNGVNQFVLMNSVSNTFYGIIIVNPGPNGIALSDNPIS